jgi:hypothetical protein
MHQQSPPNPLFWTRFADGGFRAVSANESAFLSRYRKGEVRAVEVVWSAPERGVEAQTLLLLVRVTGDRTRIVGLNPQAQARFIDR